MNADITVRVYRDDDEAAVTELWRTVFPDDPPWNAPADVIREKRAFQPDWFFVCLKGDAVVGTVLAGYDGVRGWVQKVAVDPVCQRHGIATRLMETAERALRDAGCRKLNLQTRTGNDAAVAFYRRAGFTVEERISMSKRL